MRLQAAALFPHGTRRREPSAMGTGLHEEFARDYPVEAREQQALRPRGRRRSCSLFGCVARLAARRVRLVQRRRLPASGSC